uniref:Uncharacterized protein n=1 Tax=Rhizophora mucronata TaxID=61149 RepID=A0A2P2PPU2_RHIMU
MAYSHAEFHFHENCYQTQSSFTRSHKKSWGGGILSLL